jgi:hypothetical protein
MSTTDPANILPLLAAAFGGVEDVTPAPGQPLHVLFGQIELPEPWTPSPTRALTVWRNWPAERPQFVIDQGVQGEQGEPPRSSEPVYLLGESWRTFSFSFSWSGQDPVRVIQLWMTRFVAEQS